MFEPVGPTRKLPYPLYNQVTGENVTPEEFEGDVFVWPDDPEERTIVPFYLSQREWTALGSAIDVGTDIAYPLQYIEVIRIWMRQTRYSVSICSAIIDCINNNPATRAAIVDALKSDPDFNEYLAYQVYRLTEGQIVGKLVPDDCDNSIVAGRAIALVERLDLNNKDFLEMIEVGTNDEERIADIVGAIPGLAETPVNEVIEIAQDFLEDFAENYNSISTEGRKDDMARLIYCLMKSNDGCSITFEQLFTFYQEQATSGLTIVSTFIDVVNFLKTGDFASDDALWFGMFALQIGFVLNSREFFGVEIGTISGIMRDALPSSRWEEWDPCPEEWCYTIDFTLTSGASDGVVLTVEAPGVPLFISGEWQSGVGIVFYPSGDHDRTYFTQQTPDPLYLTSALLEWEYQTPLTSGNVYIGDDFGSPTSVTSPQTSLEKTFDSATALTNLIIGGDKPGGDVTPFIILKRITYRGNGSNPFGSNNC